MKIKIILSVFRRCCCKANRRACWKSAPTIRNLIKKLILGKKKIGLQWRVGEKQKEKRLNVHFFAVVNEWLKKTNYCAFKLTDNFFTYFGALTLLTLLCTIIHKKLLRFITKFNIGKRLIAFYFLHWVYLGHMASICD